MKKKTSISLSEELIKRVKALAEQQERSLSWLCEKWINEKYLSLSKVKRNGRAAK